MKWVSVEMLYVNPDLLSFKINLSRSPIPNWNMALRTETIRNRVENLYPGQFLVFGGYQFHYLAYYRALKEAVVTAAKPNLRTDNLWVRPLYLEIGVKKLFEAPDGRTFVITANLTGAGTPSN